jgi:hypothetical protein
MDVEIVKAIVASVSTIVVAALALLGVIYQARKPSRTKPPESSSSSTTGQALEAFNGTQNEFMALVIADNKTMRIEMTAMKETVEGIKKHQDTFLGAVRRYLMKLASAWDNSGPMPWPDENDFHILEDTLPSRPAGGTIKRKDG